jgi:hypothetical protein
MEAAQFALRFQPAAQRFYQRKLAKSRNGLDQGTQDTCGKKFPPTPKNPTSLLKSIAKKEKALQT